MRDCEIGDSEKRKPSAPVSVERAAFNQRDASIYLGFEPGSRWLDEAPIPRADVRLPGSMRPVWRWRRVDLDEFLASRVIVPGQTRPIR